MKGQSRMKSHSRSRGGKRLHDDAPIGLALIGPEGRFPQVNPGLCPLRGHTRRQLPRTTPGPVTDPRDLDLMASNSRRLQAGEVDEIHLVLDDLFDGVMTTDEHGRIAFFNRAARRLFGYQTGEILGHEARLIIAEPYQEMFAGYLAGRMRPGRATPATSASREMWGRRKDGSTFPIELRAARQFLGGETRFVGILRDLSEQKARTEALESAPTHAVGDALWSQGNCSWC